MQHHGVDAKPLSVDHYYLPLDRQPKYQVRACVRECVLECVCAFACLCEVRRWFLPACRCRRVHVRVRVKLYDAIPKIHNVGAGWLEADGRVGGCVCVCVCVCVWGGGGGGGGR